MSNSIGDVNLGVGHQSIAVLQYLANMEPAFANVLDGGSYDVRTETRTWYNGRERGICVSMISRTSFSHPTIHVAVFEYRNDDNIIGLTWETDRPYSNGPNEDFDTTIYLAYGRGGTKYDYAARFGGGEVGKCADWVYDTLATAYKNSFRELQTTKGVE
jgi:hypothetical protein